MVARLEKERKTPALIVGMRQCGKTKSIIEFGNNNYKNIIEINFWLNKEYSMDFDEIQECPRARLAFKSFAIDGRYDVIGSGSYIGINGYVVGDSTPIPTGYENVYNMHTLNFEEFLWANGYIESQISILDECFQKKMSSSKFDVCSNI